MSYRFNDTRMRKQFKVNILIRSRSLIDQFKCVYVAYDIIILKFIQLPGQSQDISFYIASQEQHAREDTYQYKQNGGKSFHPGSKCKFLLLFNLFFRIKTY